MAYTPTRTGLARLTAAAAAGALVLAGCGPFGSSDKRAVEARKIGESFLAEWSANKLLEAGALTTDPKAAENALREVQTDLRPDERAFTPGDVACEKKAPCTLEFDAVLALNALGDWRWSSALQIVEQDDKTWKVAWAPSLIHPQLTPETRLRRVRDLPERAAILDRNGRPLVTEQAVKRVGVEAGKIPDGAIEDLAELLDVNVDGLATRANKAPSGQFVEAVVLRLEDYEAVESSLSRIPGVVVQEDKLSLAKTRAFARGVLGAVNLATKETLAAAGPGASSSDSIGSSGLQKLYQLQLAGRPGGHVDIVARSGSDAVIATLAEFTKVPGKAVTTTLDYDIQTAAEDALRLTTENSSLVAIDTKTGDILAVANGPAEKSGEPRALTGQYAPGSTFKIVTATALLRKGVKPEDTVDCPASVVVNGKRFENYDGLGAVGSVPFRRDFALSCNTAFAKGAAGLEDRDLTEAADSFGIGRAWDDLGLSAFSGDVPAAYDEVERAADGIGQGRVLMSPLAMAMVAAAVADGTPRTPRLVTGDGPDPAYALDTPASGSPSAIPTVTLPGDLDEPAALEELPEAATLRELMYETVQNGNAGVLNIPGQKVGAKTGTAEYGSETEPGKHAWMVGFSGDIAFAVIVENGQTGAITAGPIARAFLQSVGDRVSTDR